MNKKASNCSECDALWFNYQYDDACDKHGGPGAIRRVIDAAANPPPFRDQVRAAERKRAKRIVVAWRLVLIVVWVVGLVVYLSVAKWGW